ncbi:MAG TPA: VOC family protein [Phycisphaerales bacterium]|nr:VOC family protein [Phycisphaerales bacterium]
MRFEHLGINVPDARAMARWYERHLNMRTVRGEQQPPWAHFLADASGRTVLEVYTNTADPLPDYARQHPLRFHLAFAVDDPDDVGGRLIAAGAQPLSDQTLDDGSRIVMVRDPWGLVVQLVHRATPLP